MSFYKNKSIKVLPHMCSNKMSKESNPIQALEILHSRDKTSKLESPNYAEQINPVTKIKSFIASRNFWYNGTQYKGQGIASTKKEAHSEACQQIYDKISASPVKPVEQKRKVATPEKVVSPVQGSSLKLVSSVRGEPPANCMQQLEVFCKTNGLSAPKFQSKPTGELHDVYHNSTCKVGVIEKSSNAKKASTSKNGAAYLMLQHLQQGQQTPKQGTSRQQPPPAFISSPDIAKPKLLQVNTPSLQKSPNNSKIQLDGTQVQKNIYYYKNEMLGSQTSSTVFKGYFMDASEVKRPAAVKRIESGDNSNDIQILVHLDHPHIVKYFLSEECPHTINKYLAMELACGTLEDLIKKKMSFDTRQFLLEATRGLEYLHNQPNKILHRDIKPSNILAFKQRSGEWTAKLADFGISKELDGNKSGATTQVRGTSHWMPPEALLALSNHTKFQIKPSFDIYSLGLVIFYTCTKGKHPFKDNDTGDVGIPVNILKNNLQWKYFNGSENFSAVNLLSKMLDKNPDNRATTPTLLLKHPFFWDDEKSLRFILAVTNDHKNDKSLEVKSTLHRDYLPFWTMWKKGETFSWKTRLCFKVQEFIKNRKHNKKYSESGLLSLIEFIRDHNQHYAEWKEYGLDVEEFFGKEDKTYAKYFITKFPELVPFLYTYSQKKNGMKSTEFYAGNNSQFFPMLTEIPKDIF